jgi:hypothetical protein
MSTLSCSFLRFSRADVRRTRDLTLFSVPVFFCSRSYDTARTHTHVNRVHRRCRPQAERGGTYLLESDGTAAAGDGAAKGTFVGFAPPDKLLAEEDRLAAIGLALDVQPLRPTLLASDVVRVVDGPRPVVGVGVPSCQYQPERTSARVPPQHDTYTRISEIREECKENR